jgi:hypothetical protein
MNLYCDCAVLRPFNHFFSVTTRKIFSGEYGVVMAGRISTLEKYRAIEVQFPAQVKIFYSGLCVQTGSGAHPASCTMGTGCPFPGSKARSGRDANHSPLSIAEVVNE